MKKTSIFTIKKSLEFDLHLILSKYPELKDYSVSIIPIKTKIKGGDYSATVHDRKISISKYNY